jgi:hypothetical protein
MPKINSGRVKGKGRLFVLSGLRGLHSTLRSEHLPKQPP